MIIISSNEYFDLKQSQYYKCNLNIFEQERFKNIVKKVNNVIKLSLENKKCLILTIKHSDIFPHIDSGVNIDKEINNLRLNLKNMVGF